MASETIKIETLKIRVATERLVLHLQDNPGVHPARSSYPLEDGINWALEAVAGQADTLGDIAARDQILELVKRLEAPRRD